MAGGSKIWQLSYWSHTWRDMPVRDKKLLGLVVIVHFLLTCWFIRQQGVLYDESDYFSYALSWLKGHPERQFPIMDSKTPLVAMSVAPVALKPLLPADILEHDPFFFLKAGRYFMYIYQLLGIYIFYCWISKIWGGLKWLLPLLFYAFDPLIFSYGMVIGSDLPSAGLLVFIIYTTWRYCDTGQRRYWWMLCVTSALAVVLKASLVYVYPLLLLLFSYDAITKRKWEAKKSAIQALQFVLIQLLVINCMFYFRGSFSAFGNVYFESRAFSSIQQRLGFAGHLPLPFPAAFIQGIDMLQHHAEIGGGGAESTYAGVFLLGKNAVDRGLWYYYVVVAVFKFPLFTWLLGAIFIARYLKSGKMITLLRQYVFLWLPFTWFLLVLSFGNRFQIGIRHAIILLPFAYIVLGSSLNWLIEKHRKVGALLVLLHAISVLRYVPNLIAYTNELITDKTHVYKKLRDSSIDYGQATPWIKNFIAANPQYKRPGIRADTGYFALNISALFAILDGPEHNIAWLRNNFEPFGNYRYTILLFHITEEDLKSKGLIRGK